MMAGRVGEDPYGQSILKNFASFGIEVTDVRVAAAVPTGVAPMFVDASGRHRIIVVKGTNERLTPAANAAPAAQDR